MRFANISRPSKTVGSPQLITLVISDVPGDNPSIVASGPTVRIRALLPMLRRSSCGSAWPCPHWLRLILGDALEGESEARNTNGRHRPVGTYPCFGRCAFGSPAFGRRDDSDHRA